MVAAFLIHELTTPNAWLDFHAILARPMPFLLLMIGILRLTILSTAYLIPYFLGPVRGFRALQVGDTLIWIAAPQLIICPLAALIMRRSDPRILASLGLCMVGLACMIVAYSLTPVWGSDQFLVSQLLQAVGQSFALSGIIFNGVLHLRPQDALTFGASLQISRLFGGEIGSAFVSTMARVREQRASNLIGQHLQVGDVAVQHRLAAYGHVIARGGHPASVAPAVLANLVRTAATTQATIDSFVAVAGFAAFGLVMMTIVLPAPPRTPASHIPLLRRKQPQ
jgi:DHA2 family multidrug resistance protein